MLGKQQFTQSIDPWGIFKQKSIMRQSHSSTLDVSQGPSYPVDLDDNRFTIPSSSSMERLVSPSESVSEETLSMHSEESATDDDEDWQESDGIAQIVIRMILKIIDDQKKATQFEGQQGNVREASGGGGEQADHPEDPPQDVEVPEDESDGDDGGDGDEDDDGYLDEDYDEVEDTPLDPEQGEPEEEVRVDLNDHAAHVNQRLGERFERMRRVAADVLQIPEADLIDELNRPQQGPGSTFGQMTLQNTLLYIKEAQIEQERLQNGPVRDGAWCPNGARAGAQISALKYREILDDFQKVIVSGRPAWSFFWRDTLLDWERPIQHSEETTKRLEQLELRRKAWNMLAETDRLKAKRTHYTNMEEHREMEMSKNIAAIEGYLDGTQDKEDVEKTKVPPKTIKTRGRAKKTKQVVKEDDGRRRRGNCEEGGA